MRKFLSIFIAFISIFSVNAEENWRQFTSKAGTTLEAKVFSIQGDQVILERKDNGKKMTVKIALFSDDDVIFLKDFQKQADLGTGETTIPGIDAQPGIGSGRIKALDGKWSYFVYLPENFHTGRKWPVCFVSAAVGATSADGLQRYIPAAELLNMILVISAESKNEFTESSDATLATAKDVFERFPVAEGLAFSSGMSGGSREALYLAEREKRISGVLACGSGGGIYLPDKSFRHVNLPRSTDVYSLLGTNCFNRSEAIRSHAEAFKNFRLRFFVGNHDWAPAELITPGLAKLYGLALMKKKGDEFDGHRRLYSTAMSAHMDDLIEKESWEAERWAVFLSEFPGYPDVTQHAQKVAGELENNPQVQLAREAEKDIHAFGEKHFMTWLGVEEGRKPDPKREAEAGQIAAKYSGLPHAEFILRLGKPAP